MAKILECAKVDPSSGFHHVVRGDTTEEVMEKATEHAKERVHSPRIKTAATLSS
jgi:predicted small metal-binding protein